MSGGVLQRNRLNLSALVGIQTPNLLIRSQVLYSVELRARIRCGQQILECKCKELFNSAKSIGFCTDFKKPIFGLAKNEQESHD